MRELEAVLGKFYYYFCDDKKIYQISLSYSPMCSSFVDSKDFNSEFRAIEFSLINTLNGRDTKIMNIGVMMPSVIIVITASETDFFAKLSINEVISC